MLISYYLLGTNITRARMKVLIMIAPVPNINILIIVSSVMAIIKYGLDEVNE